MSDKFFDIYFNHYVQRVLFVVELLLLVTMCIFLVKSDASLPLKLLGGGLTTLMIIDHLWLMYTWLIPSSQKGDDDTESMMEKVYMSKWLRTPRRIGDVLFTVVAMAFIPMINISLPGIIVLEITAFTLLVSHCVGWYLWLAIKFMHDE